MDRPSQDLKGGPPTPWPQQLDALLETLRQDGFRVGVPETLRVHQLLLALLERGVALDGPERLARYLGPVLCRSASQQSLFQERVASWWAQLAPAEPAEVAKVEARGAATPHSAALEAQLKGLEGRQRRWRRWLEIAAVLIGVAGMVAAVAALLPIPQNPERARSTRATAPVTTPQPIKPPAAAPAKPAAPVGAPPPEAPPLELAREEGPLLLPWEIAVLLLLASLLLAAAGYGLWRWWWWRQARMVLQRLAVKNDPQLHHIALETLIPEVVPSSQAQRLARALNRWIQRPGSELDSQATVERAIRQGGWVTPEYGQRRERLSYLFLLEQQGLADQQNRHLRAWLEQLRQEGVLAGWVTFQGDPAFCHGPEGRGPVQTLQELAAQNPDAVAVVVAEAERFFSPVDGTLVPWLEGLALWKRRAVLTPRPLTYWGAAEGELGRHIRLLPASGEELISLGQQLDPETVAAWRLDSEQIHPPAHTPEPRLLLQSPQRWIDSTPPNQELIERLLAELRAYLGAEGSTWLSACSVFPELHWTLTAYLGQTLTTAQGEPLLRVCPLLRLARLPWFRHGFMPDWLRVPLILGLPTTQEKAVREALRHLVLGAVQGGEVSGAQLTVATRHSRRVPPLIPPLLDLLRRRSGPASPLRDHLFLRFLQDRPLLAAEAPESLRRLLQGQQPGGWRWNGLQRLFSQPRALGLAALALLGTAGLGLALLQRLEQGYVDQLVRPLPGSLSAEAASETLQRAITATGLSRSTLMGLGSEREMAPAEAALQVALERPGLALRRLRGHAESVTSVAFSPDGRSIVSGSKDRTLRLWEAATGKPIGSPLQGHTLSVETVAFSPDGRRIVSGSEDNTLRLWDAATGQPIGSPLQGHKDWVRSVAFSPDGRRIVSASRDSTLRLWDAATGKPIGSVVRGHTYFGWGVIAFSPDRRRIVSGSWDNTLRLWEAATGKPISSPLQGHTKPASSVAFSPDGRRIVSGSDDNTLRLWDAATGKSIGSPLQGLTKPASSVAFSPDGRRIVSGSLDNTLRLWDAATGKPIGYPLQEHTEQVRSVAFSPDGRRIVSGSNDSTLRLWDVESKPFALGNVDGRRRIPTGQGGVLSLIELKSGELISGGSDGSLRRWRDGQAVGAAIPTGQDQVRRLIELNNGELISGGSDGSLRRWRDGKPLGAAIPTDQGVVWSLIELKNGELISGGWDGSLRRWRDGKAVGAAIPTGQGSVWSLIELKNGELISGGQDGSLKRWRDGKPVGETINTGEGAVKSLVELKNGELMSSGGRDGSLRRWRDGRPLGEKIKTGQGQGWSLIALKNGELISGGQDGSLKRWRDGKAVGAAIPTGQGPVLSLIELNNGVLISGGLYGDLRWGRLGPGWRELLPQACRRLEAHPRLQEWGWLNTARATCHHFVWRYRAVPLERNRAEEARKLATEQIQKLDQQPQEAIRMRKRADEAKAQAITARRAVEAAKQAEAVQRRNAERQPIKAGGFGKDTSY